MSILIKGMEMPTVGTGKVIMIDSDGDVWAAGKDECTIIAGAKAVPVPPHGDLIDRDAVCYQLEKQESIDGQPRAIRRALRIVADFPAADVVARDCYDRLLAENDDLRKERPVVRCGECKHWWDNGTDLCSCDRDALLRRRDFFCADGERKDGGGECE